MNHNTLNDQVKAYIDNVVKLGFDMYEVTGWIYSPIGETSEIYAGFPPIEGGLSSIRSIEFSKISRPDVVAVYPESITTQLGFKIRFHITDLRNPIWASFGENGEKIKIFDNLMNWAVSYTGFAREMKDLVVVDGFYEDPDLIREYAMKHLQYNLSDYHKGKRSTDRFIIDGTKERLEKILGTKIINWNKDEYANGVFQYCTPLDPIVYHVDTQTYAAMVFLTPNAPVNTGTAFYKSKITGATSYTNDNFDAASFEKTFKGLSNELNFYDSTQYELMDEVANVYNRIVLFNAKRIHAATKYFGDAIENARFFQLFFFDIEQ